MQAFERNGPAVKVKSGGFELKEKKTIIIIIILISQKKWEKMTHLKY